VRTRRRRRPTGALRQLALIVVTVGSALTPLTSSAHDEIAGSDPPSGAQLDAPIDRVTIDFGEPISDDLEMTLLYDLGGSETEALPGTVHKDGETVGVLEFEELSRPGRYFVRYLVSVPVDGHVVAGAITFEYGDGSDGTSWALWIVFGVLAVVVLAIGAWFSFRPRAADPEREEA
jgi:methionine-rich copper-binding protein CopC